MIVIIQDVEYIEVQDVEMFQCMEKLEMIQRVSKILQNCIQTGISKQLKCVCSRILCPICYIGLDSNRFDATHRNYNFMILSIFVFCDISGKTRC